MLEEMEALRQAADASAPGPEPTEPIVAQKPRAVATRPFQSTDSKASCSFSPGLQPGPGRGAAAAPCPAAPSPRTKRGSAQGGNGEMAEGFREKPETLARELASGELQVGQCFCPRWV